MESPSSEFCSLINMRKCTCIASGAQLDFKRYGCMWFCVDSLDNVDIQFEVSFE